MSLADALIAMGIGLGVIVLAIIVLMVIAAVTDQSDGSWFSRGTHQGRYPKDEEDEA